MVRRQRKTCRWPITALNVLLLQTLLVSAGHAGSVTGAADGSAASPALLPEGNDQFDNLGASDLYLDVTVNGQHMGLAHMGYRDGQIWAGLATMRELGFNLPLGTPDPVNLQSLKGLQTNYDSSHQSLTLLAPLSLLKLSTTVLGGANSSRPIATASPGLLLNYNLYGTYGTQGTNSLSAFTELRAFNSWGVLSSTSLAQSIQDAQGQRTNSNVRLDTSWSLSFPESLVTLRVGDTLTDALTWSRSTRIGGIQVGTNFGLQPYLVTAPLPAFFGSATLPSDVQLYVNGLRQFSGQIPAGPFQLNTLPNINGAGNAQVVLTNALGQTTTLNFSLYGEHQLLQQGLTDWSGELGYVRENYGIDSFDYGHDPVGSGTWRYGVTNKFTMEAHAELTPGLSNAGVGGNLLLGDAGGVVSAAVAHSENQGQSGGQYAVGYSWNSANWGLGANGQRATGSYRDVASLYGSPTPRSTAQAYVSYNFQRLGAISTSFLQLSYPQQPSSRYATLSWFKSLRNDLTFNLSYNQDLNNSRDRIIYATVTLSLDHNRLVTGSLQHTSTGTSTVVSALQSLPSEGGLGWRASLSQGDNLNGGQGELDYLGRYGQVQAGAYDVGNVSYGYAGAVGAVVLMGGDVFASRQITDGFAVVSTDGVANVPVNLQNNLVGTTDSHGMLLITPLNSYQANKVSIDPMNLPADVAVSRVEASATPTDHAGTLVRFGITPIRAAVITLVDAQGKSLPLGSQVQLHDHGGEPALVGFDGVVYLDTLGDHNQLDVQTPDGTCRASFDFPKAGGIPQIGPLTCKKATP